MNITPINANNIEITNNKITKLPNFKSNDTLSNDVAEIQEKTSKDLSNTAKWGIGIGSVILLGGAVIYGLMHGRIKDFEKLYDKKLIKVKLPERIEFKEAKTIEEGIKFSKETLKIKEVDSNITLDAINYANKSLVDVSNAHKGDLMVPTAIRYRNPSGAEYASVDIEDIRSNTFGELTINKNYFEEESLNKLIQENCYSKKTGKPFLEFDSAGKCQSRTVCNNVMFGPEGEQMTNLWIKLNNNPETLTLSDKRKLYFSSRRLLDRIHYKQNYAPMDYINDIPKYWSEKLTQDNISINVSELSKKTLHEQKDFLNNLYKKGYYNVDFMKMESEDYVIYHEMGHLQDALKNMAKNGKLMDKNCTFATPWADRMVTKSSLSRAQQKYGTNKVPTEFKEFLENDDTQRTAGKISTYAQSGIGEFIAETYAKMIKGENIPDDVMALYKKYNGTTI